MSDCKRCAPTIAAMGEASSTKPVISKKRKITCESHYSLGDFPNITVSSGTSVNSAGTVVSGELCSDRSPLSCCSSSYAIEITEVVKELETAPLDLELKTKGFETVDSTKRYFKSFRLLSEFSGDSEESTRLPALNESRTMKTPPMEEIEEFFATAERLEQKRFAEKYNFDIVRDMPLEGRYQWVRLH